MKRALVTGGASGLGAASAARLRADGLAVTTLDVSGRADVVTDEAALRRVAGEIGPVDVLINSAGIMGSFRSPGDACTASAGAPRGCQLLSSGVHQRPGKTGCVVTQIVMSGRPVAACASRRVTVLVTKPERCS